MCGSRRDGGPGVRAKSENLGERPVTYGPQPATGLTPGRRETAAHAPQPACSPPTRSATIFSAHPDRRYAAIGSGSSPISSRSEASSGRTSVLYASMITAFASSTSPDRWAFASASPSTRSAFAVASWTFITDRMIAGIFASML
ncbi:hypothetical protein SALBM311S_05911 [Streptomyces alboniger]